MKTKGVFRKKGFSPNIQERQKAVSGLNSLKVLSTNIEEAVDQAKIIIKKDYWSKTDLILLNKVFIYLSQNNYSLSYERSIIEKIRGEA